MTALLAAASAAFAQPSPPAADPYFGRDVVPGEVIVAYKHRAASFAKSAILSRVGATFKQSLLLPLTDVVSVPPGQERAAAAALERDPSVLYAEPNGIVHALVTPDDARFGELWGLNNTGQVIQGVAGTKDADIDAPEGWNLGLGVVSNVIVGDIDTGVAATHPDLAANMFLNPGESGGGKETNGTDDDSNGFIDDFRGWDFVNNDNDPTDDHDHGSHVAGTIAGRSNNGLGVAGVASFPTAAGEWGGPKILAIKVLNAAGSGSFSQITNGISYAGTMGAKVGNLSLGGNGTSAAVDAAFAANPNTLYIVAAGNNGRDVDTQPITPCVPDGPVDVANKICVAATDNKDQLASFSNFGDVNVDLAAPGVAILSTLPGDTYAFFNGTSMATPHVTGAAAFLFSTFPTATVADIKEKIFQGVDKKSAVTGKVVTDGRLNLYKAGAESTAAKSGSTLQWHAGAGQTNTVTVTKVGTSFRITDPYSTSPTAIQSGSRIIPGAGCSRVNLNTVTCPARGIKRIVLTGGDLNDKLHASTIAIPLTLNGGPGNDELVGGSAGDSLVGGLGPDRFTAGTGNDTVNARNDDVDTLFSCGENAGDHDVVLADKVPNDPITAQASNCEVVKKL